MKAFLTVALALSTMAAAQTQSTPPAPPAPTPAQQAKGNAIAKAFTGRTCKTEGMDFAEFKPSQYMSGTVEKERVRSNQTVDIFVKQFKTSGLKVVKDTKTPTGRYVFVQSPDMQKAPLSLLIMHDLKKEGGITLTCELN